MKLVAIDNDLLRMPRTKSCAHSYGTEVFILPFASPLSVGMVKTNQSDHVQVISDWPVSLLNCHFPDKGLAKVVLLNLAKKISQFVD